MASAAPPTIFDPDLRYLRALRISDWEVERDVPRYIDENMGEDVMERLAFLRHEPKRPLICGTAVGSAMLRLLRQTGEVQYHPTGLEEEPHPSGGFDFVVSLGALDTVNDLPGALIHLREALVPGGLMIAQFLGAGSLPVLRQCMLAADGERPAARMHPMVDVRAGGQLLQRCGFARPVVDSRGIDVSYRSFLALVRDLRAQTVGNVLVSRPPPLTKAALARAEETFATLADSQGRVTEHFEILTLSGWRA